jgi:hypothetical protein
VDFFGQPASAYEGDQYDPADWHAGSTAADVDPRDRGLSTNNRSIALPAKEHPIGVLTMKDNRGL